MFRIWLLCPIKLGKEAVMEYYMNRCWQNNVCVSRGLKAQQFHSPGHRPGF